MLSIDLKMGCCESRALGFVDSKHEATVNRTVTPKPSNLQRSLRHKSCDSTANIIPENFKAVSFMSRMRGHSLKRVKSVFNKSSFVVDRVAKLSSLYNLESSIGEGSFGKVTKATNKKTGQQCAIKTIRYDNLSLDRVEALFREVDILRELVRTMQDHPYIIKIYQVIYEDAYIHIVTELCTGGELFDRLVLKRSFPEDEAIEYMFQIMSAVNYLHLNCIVHRDIKPENLLLATKASDSPLKLIDFGTSQICDPLNKLSQVAGTPYYIAPEILRGTYDEKCDVWSCGVILYMMLCGKPPFTGTSRDDLFSCILLGKYRMDGPEWRGISFEAKELVKEMLTLDPLVRPSAKQVLDNCWINFGESSKSTNLMKINHSYASDSRFPHVEPAIKSLKNMTRFRVISS